MSCDCDRFENLIKSWNEEREFQKQTSSDDYQRGLSMGFFECVRDLSEALASMRLEGLREKLPEHVRSHDDRQQWDFLDEILKPRDEDPNPG